MIFKKLVLVLLLSTVLSVSNVAQKKNVVYVVMEGLSRSTFYTLLQKDKLPAVKAAIASGNYRNAFLEQVPTANDEAALQLYTGVHLSQSELVTKNFALDRSIYMKLLMEDPELSIGFFLTKPLKRDYDALLDYYLNEHLTYFHDDELRYQTTVQVGEGFANFVRQSEGRFFAVINFTNADYVASRYREGTQLYSQAAQNCDRALMSGIKALKEKGLLESTEFFIVTNVGYDYQLPYRNEKIWMASSRKIMRKGKQYDVFPSLLDLLGLSDSALSQSLSGTSLFK